MPGRCWRGNRTDIRIKTHFLPGAQTERLLAHWSRKTLGNLPRGDELQVQLLFFDLVWCAGNGIDWITVDAFNGQGERQQYWFERMQSRDNNLGTPRLFYWWYKLCEKLLLFVLTLMVIRQWNIPGSKQEIYLYLLVFYDKKK